MAKSIANTTILVYNDTNLGLALDATINGGTIPTTTLTFSPGCRMVDLSTGIVSINAGTAVTPRWEQQKISTTVSLTAAQVIAMYTTPVAIVDAVPGKAIIVDSMDMVVTRTSTAFTGGGVVAVQYANTANGGGTATTATIATSVITGTVGVSYTARIPVVQSDIATASITGIGLFISNATAAFAAGTGTAVVNVTYHLV